VVTAGTGSVVGIYCDLGPQIGAGHAVRCTALAQGLARRGLTPVLVGDFAQVPWVAQQAHGLELLEAPNVAEFVAQARAREWSGVVVDSYVATTEHWHGIRSLGVPALAIDDEAKRDLPVDLVLNQNLAAVDYDYAARTQAPVLRGPNYALIRTSIAAARPTAYDERAGSDGPLRVLVVLGGTDSAGGSVSLAERLLGSGQPVHLRVVTGDADSLHRLGALATPAGSRVDGLAPRPDVEALMAWADLAVSAAGSTVWELCCLGVPMALVTVAPNQEDNYRHLVAANVALGLGPLPHVRQSSESLAWILDRARVDEVGRAGWQTVDGHGADRVAAAFAALLTVGP
jgi:spore coat polysaccharide biosynthesis predicted glycosyltransferase SpsG